MVGILGMPGLFSGQSQPYLFGAFGRSARAGSADTPKRLGLVDKNPQISNLVLWAAKLLILFDMLRARHGFRRFLSN